MEILNKSMDLFEFQDLFQRFRSVLLEFNSLVELIELNYSMNSMKKKIYSGHEVAKKREEKGVAVPKTGAGRKAS